jgi:hypothetical protein
MANENDITMFRGDSYGLAFTITDSDTSLPVSLAGATLKMTVTTIRDPPDDTTKLFDVDGVVDADPMTGKVVFKPTSLNTAAIGKYFYDIQLSGAGDVRTVQKAGFNIIQDNTK